MSAEILTKKVPVSLGTGPSLRRTFLRCSWAPRNWRHPEIPSICTKPRKCNSKLSSAKVKDSLEKNRKNSEKVGIGKCDLLF